ncbi:AraC family transcriptional regulator [Paenibacillus sp. J5C_2022]|uniref:AraC family transcriptional regulator n=1 Tax=Paenibacillus sp. J5C2022 TaxID=2977129 RepID=UPI0021D0D52A|nr:AraC family transcriptional regulator [Paenibacillus sp. J5C2022]MCU6712820.1 AraC family transcriptional regulator [Paenibacillus sp. J5C2022]
MRRSPLRYRLTFKQSLLLYSILLSVLPVLLLGYIFSQLSSGSIREEVDRTHAVLLQQMEYQVDTMLADLESASIRIADDLIIQKSLRLGISMTEPEPLAVTLDMLETIQQYRSYADIAFDISLVYSRYDTVYSNASDRNGLSPQHESPHYELIRSVTAANMSSFVVPPYTRQDQHDLLLVRPIGVSELDGILILEVSREAIDEYFEHLPIPSMSKMMVLDEEGRIVISTDRRESGHKLSPTSLWYGVWSGERSPREEIKTLDGDFTVSLHPSAFKNWSYLVITPSDELNGKAMLMKRTTWAVAGGLIALWLAIAIIGSNRLYSPLDQLLRRLPRSKETGEVGELRQLDSYMQQVQRTNERLARQIHEQLPRMREGFYLQLLRGDMTKKELSGKLASLEPPLRGYWFYVLAVEVDDIPGFMKTYSNGRDRGLIMYAMAKLIDELCEQLPSFITAAPQLGRIAGIAGMNVTDDDSDLLVQHFSESIRDNVRQYFGLTVSVAISKPCKGYGSIHEGYMQAADLLGYRLLLGQDTTLIAGITDSSAQLAPSSMELVAWQKRIVRLIGTGELKEAERQTIELIDSMRQLVTSAKPIIGLFAHFIGEIDHLLRESGNPMSEFLAEQLEWHLYPASSAEQIKECFREGIFPALRQHIEHLNGNGKQKTVQQIQEYVERHYDTDLSLQQVADYCGLSIYQIGRLFKDELGTTFVDYVIQYRVAKAKEWLVHTEMPIKEITERLRYTTTQNFSRIFKQVTGMPPGLYRNEARSGGKESC